MDDIDTLESGGRVANMDKHMSNLSVSDSKSQGNSANIKLGPVITRKTLSHNSANSLNTLQRLPPQQPAKTRSIPITPEKSTIGKKNESSWPVSPARKVAKSFYLPICDLKLKFNHQTMNTHKIHTQFFVIFSRLVEMLM